VVVDQLEGLLRVDLSGSIVARERPRCGANPAFMTVGASCRVGWLRAFAIGVVVAALAPIPDVRA
jgi:hypothetical protein